MNTYYSPAESYGEPSYVDAFRVISPAPDLSSTSLTKVIHPIILEKVHGTTTNQVDTDRAAFLRHQEALPTRHTQQVELAAFVLAASLARPVGHALDINL